MCPCHPNRGTFRAVKFGMWHIPRQSKEVTCFEVFDLAAYSQPIFASRHMRADIEWVCVGVEFQVGIPFADNDFIKTLIQ